MSNENEVTDLTTIGDLTGVATRPKDLERSHAGTEDIGVDEVRLPRLAIAQGLSPQITPGDAQFIPGLTLFSMFNDLTGEIFGQGPITFVPVRRDIRRIEFTPRSEGGGIVDLAVPKNDERMKWTVEDGVRIPPRATEFTEFVILLLIKGKAPQPIVFSIKTTNKWNKRASDQLTTFIKLGEGQEVAIYGKMYTVDTLTPAKNDKGTFGVPVVKQAGFVPVDTPGGRALYEYAKTFAASLEGKTIVVDRDGEIDDSMAANPEGAAAEM